MRKLKRILLTMLCSVGAAALAACSSPQNSTGMANPFIECSDLTAAARVSGFEMAVPETANSYTQTGIQAVRGEMIQVFYAEGENSICIRKAAKSVLEGSYTLTGDYNNYSYSAETTVGDIKVILKGDAAEEISAAAWINGEYCYAVTARGEALSQKTVEALVTAVK